jgi:hypothetical protein
MKKIPLLFWKKEKSISLHSAFNHWERCQRSACWNTENTCEQIVKINQEENQERRKEGKNNDRLQTNQKHDLSVLF